MDPNSSSAQAYGLKPELFEGEGQSLACNSMHSLLVAVCLVRGTRLLSFWASAK